MPLSHSNAEPYFFKMNGYDIESKLVDVLSEKDMLTTPNPHYHVAGTEQHTRKWSPHTKLQVIFERESVMMPNG